MERGDTKTQLELKGGRVKPTKGNSISCRMKKKSCLSLVNCHLSFVNRGRDHVNNRITPLLANCLIGPWNWPLKEDGFCSLKEWYGKVTLYMYKALFKLNKSNQIKVTDRKFFVRWRHSRKEDQRTYQLMLKKNHILIPDEWTGVLPLLRCCVTSTILDGCYVILSSNICTVAELE